MSNYVSFNVIKTTAFYVQFNETFYVLKNRFRRFAIMNFVFDDFDFNETNDFFRRFATTSFVESNLSKNLTKILNV